MSPRRRSSVNGLKRGQLIAMNSMTLRAVYCDGLGGGGQRRPPRSPAISAASTAGGSEFSAIGKAEGGSGWTIVAYSPRGNRLLNHWAADHPTTLAGGRPFVVLDLYEHAYHMDYGATAAACV